MPDLLDQLRNQRTAARTTADEILIRAAAEQRDLTPDELAELRAAQTRRPWPAAPREPS